MKPKIPDILCAGIRKALDEELMKQSGDIPPMYQFLNKDHLNAIVTLHSVMKEDLDSNAKRAISECLDAFESYKKITAEMIAESEKLGLLEIANEYRDVSTRVGKTKEEIKLLKLSFSRTENTIIDTEQRIFDLRSLSQKILS